MLSAPSCYEHCSAPGPSTILQHERNTLILPDYAMDWFDTLLEVLSSELISPLRNLGSGFKVRSFSNRESPAFGAPDLHTRKHQAQEKQANP